MGLGFSGLDLLGLRFSASGLQGLGFMGTRLLSVGMMENQTQGQNGTLVLSIDVYKYEGLWDITWLQLRFLVAHVWGPS